MTPRLGSSGLLTGALVLSGACGFHVDRERDPGDEVHPIGFANPDSTAFHGPYLAAHGYPLADCRSCHGDDYAGGTVGSSCASAGCHTEGVESCGTCHDDPPMSEGHPAHGASCTTCHPAHTDARSPDHPSGAVDFAFGGLSLAGGSSPAFDPGSKTCSDVYCHGGGPIAWDAPGPLECDACHKEPPATHAGYATAESDCTACHGDIGLQHVDGAVQLAPLACDSCHGHGPLGAPPVGLLGAMVGGAVGAHARHLDASLPDRIGRVAKCRDCHLVPATFDAPGHIDEAPPADVALPASQYDPALRGCVVGCHWDRDPGPQWDDASGAERACDACHGFPPAVTRTGGPHPPTAPDAGVCATCHLVDPATHVDGKVDFTW